MATVPPAMDGAGTGLGWPRFAAGPAEATQTACVNGAGLGGNDMITVFDRDPAAYTLPRDLVALVGLAARSGAVARIDTTDPTEANVTIWTSGLVVNARWTRAGADWRFASADDDDELDLVTARRLVAPSGLPFAADGAPVGEYAREDPEDTPASVPAGVELQPVGAGPGRHANLGVVHTVNPLKEAR